MIGNASNDDENNEVGMSSPFFPKMLKILNLNSAKYKTIDKISLRSANERKRIKYDRF